MEGGLIDLVLGGSAANILIGMVCWSMLRFGRTPRPGNRGGPERWIDRSNMASHHASRPLVAAAAALGIGGGIASLVLAGVVGRDAAGLVVTTIVITVSMIMLVGVASLRADRAGRRAR